MQIYQRNLPLHLLPSLQRLPISSLATQSFKAFQHSKQITTTNFKKHPKNTINIKSYVDNKVMKTSWSDITRPNKNKTSSHPNPPNDHPNKSNTPETISRTTSTTDNNNKPWPSRSMKWALLTPSPEERETSTSKT